MAKYFGTDGFRGEANNVLTADHAYKIGRYLGWYYNQNHKGRIVIGKDTRRSSYMFEYALVAGITASGSDAFLLHATTTPSVAYVVRTENFDCGIMVSASHNPYYDNGIKVLDGEGHKISADVEAALEEYIDGESGELPFATLDKIGVAKDYAIGRNRYVGFLISLATRSYDGMRVGLDCSNGSSFNIAKSVFDALGAKTYVVGNEPDGTNINMGCGSTHIENLQKLVKEKNLDCGFAFDGDADRCIAVDENGVEVHGDFILYVCGKYLKECGKLRNNTVVATIMSNMGLRKAMKQEGINLCETTVGDKYVNEAMVANGYVLGGEQSGHIIFSKHATTGDGILTALMLMEVILEKKQSLGTLCKGMKMYPQLLVNVRVDDKDAAINHPQVQALLKQIVDELGDDGRILLRKSGTEPVVRVMVEAQSDEVCRKYVDLMVQKMREEKLIVEVKNNAGVIILRN
jgi:phosphoglucosamine mutase